MMQCEQGLGAKIDLPLLLLLKDFVRLIDCAKMIAENITVRAVLVRSKKTVERETSVLRTRFGSLVSKEGILNFVFDELFSDLSDIKLSSQNFKIERKSKKHKRFVSLEYADDFKELMRSVKVKNHVKLVIYEIENNVQPKESAVTDALDQVRRLVGELQKSELWEILKTFTTAYNMQLLADGECLSDDVGRDVEPRAAQKEDIIHEFVACDSCHPQETFGNIHGTRYKCVVCENFDLCEQCYLSKVVIMGHQSDHPMMVIPDSRQFRELHHSRPLPQYLGSFSSGFVANQESILKNFLNERFGSDGPDLLAKLDKCLANSEKYTELETMLEDNPDKFELLKKIVTRSNTCGSSSESNETSWMQEDRNVVIRNTSNNDVPVGKLLFDCYSSNGSKIWTKDHELCEQLGPGSTFSLDLRQVKLDHSRGSELRMLHSDSGLQMSGQFGVIVNMSCPDTGDSNENLAKEKLECLGGKLTSIDLNVTIIPKGTTLSQVIIGNKSEFVFECDHLNFEIINCFEKTVATVSAHRKHSLLPGRVAKFNILVNNAHFKYPFKLNVDNGTFQGCCELSLKSLSQIMTLVPIIRNGAYNDIQLSPEINNSADEIVNGSDFSKDFGDSTLEQEKVNEDLEDDFDLISLADVEEVLSDFEVLSNVNSNET